jgi:c(7)-type cytochrome triheme protein
MQVFTSLVNVMHCSWQMTKLRFAGLVIFIFGWMIASLAVAGEWTPLAQDGIHDPRSPGAKLLQQPGEALSKLTGDTAGNQVRWVQALLKGEIQPREKLSPDRVIEKLDRDIILDVNGGMPAVRFPHRQHTEWLDCTNCHDRIFKRQTGGTKISMFLILQGEQSGVCHGAVAFPLTECMRCHSIAKQAGKPLEIPPGADLMKHQPILPKP